MVIDSIVIAGNNKMLIILISKLIKISFHSETMNLEID